MIDYKKELIDIFENDNSLLLDITPQITSITDNQKWIDIFSEIKFFFKKYKRKPNDNGSISERRLSTILNEIKSDYTKSIFLKEHDQYNLLGNIKEISTLEDIFENRVIRLCSAWDLRAFLNTLVNAQVHAIVNTLVHT